VRAATAGPFVFTESRHVASLPMHAHEPWTITILLGGGFEESYAGRRHTQTCADFAVLVRRPGEVHADRMGPRGAHNLVLETDEALVRRAPALAAGNDALRGAALEVAARRLHREMASTDSARSLALEGMALELVALLTRAGAGHPDVVQRARERLSDRFREPGLRIADLAADLDVHPVVLARDFRAALGVSPSEYVRGLRLDWAAEELRRPARSIPSVAIAAGFADQSHFTRSFRARFGVTPGRFRRDAGT